VWYYLDNDIEKCNWAVTKGMVWEAEGMTIHFEYYGPYTWNDTEYHAYRFNYGSLMEMGTVIWMYALYPTSTPLVGDTATYVLMDWTSMGQGIIDVTNDMNIPISSIVTSSGKGVIYRMIDDKDNDIHYDFKNIQFVRKITNGALDLENGVDTYCYTFSDFSTGTLLDASESLSTTRYNKFGLSCWNTVFLGKDSSAYCYHNTFGDDCYNNTFGDSCHSNTLDNSCFDNIFGDYCSDNTFSDHCNTNIFGDSCRDNTFGNTCHDNIFTNDCYNNNFGDDCYQNTFGDSCHDNTFGNNCFYNTFGTNCYHNTFDNNCQNNTFGEYCIDNAFRNYCSHNTFGDICKYNTFGISCNSNTFGNNCYDNIFDNACYNNTFGNYCNKNYFSNYCFDNTFGDTCCDNTFGNSYGNTFGTAESPLSNIWKYNIDCVSKAEIAAVVDRDCITYVRKTAGGKIFTYTEDDVYNLFKPTS
jgi:hypothetical protein